MQEAISNNFKISLKSISFNLLLLLVKITRELLNYYKYLKTQFLVYLLVLLAGRPCLYLMVDLAIGRAELIGGKITVSFSGYFF